MLSKSEMRRKVPVVGDKITNKKQTRFTLLKVFIEK